MRPDVSILVPARDEEATIGELLERLRRVTLDKEILVVDDGSADRTLEIARGFPDVSVLRHPTPLGKGRAIRTALGLATGEVVAIQDADLEYDPEDLPSVCRPILRGEADIVYGTRFAHGLHPDMALPNKVINALLIAEVRLLFGAKLTDEATCYKAFRRTVLLSMDLQCERFEFCPEVTAKALRAGRTIREVPVRYTPRTVGRGKKVRARDGAEALWTLLRYRFLTARPS